MVNSNSNSKEMQMLPSEFSYYGTESESRPEEKGHFQEPTMLKVTDGGESMISSASEGEKKPAVEASKSHREAERRRRQRINAHLSTLRSLLPNNSKKDKASLLAEVVHRLRELRKEAAEIGRLDGDGSVSEPQQRWPFPGESDEARLSYSHGEANTIKVCICCEDRPGLNGDLTQAIRLVRARMIRAEMMTVGGRTKSVLAIERAHGNAGDEDLRVLKRALKAVVENRVSSFGFGPVAHCKKRARFYGFVSDGDDGFSN